MTNHTDVAITTVAIDCPHFTCTWMNLCRSAAVSRIFHNLQVKITDTKNIISLQTARCENFTQTHLILTSQYDRGYDQFCWIILAYMLGLHTIEKRASVDNVWYCKLHITKTIFHARDLLIEQLLIESTS
jgi:hypothetical protein